MNAQDLLLECKLQLEYLNEVFGETGTSNALLSKINIFLKNMDDNQVTSNIDMAHVVASILHDFLMQNLGLRISMSTSSEYSNGGDGYVSVEATLTLGGKEICSSSDYVYVQHG